jgi:hypothetical protein
MKIILKYVYMNRNSFYLTLTRKQAYYKFCVGYFLALILHTCVCILIKIYYNF